MAAPILVTGFGPFGAVRDNPSAAIAERLDGRLCGDALIIGAVLPVEIETLEARLATLIERVRPAAVLQFGVAESRIRLSLERRALNRAEFSMPDIHGVSWRNRSLTTDGPPQCEATLPLESIADAWARDDLAYEFSDDAGRYLCNASLYFGLHLAARYTPAPLWGFIHVPLPCEENPVSLLSREDIHRAARLAADVTSRTLSPTVIV